jgi:hypothetical protein
MPHARGSQPVARLCISALVAASLVFAQGPPAVGDDTRLWACGTDAAAQAYTIDAGPFPYNHIFLTGSSLGGGLFLVIDIADWSNTTDSEVRVWSNSSGKLGINQQWTYDPVGGTIKSLMNDLCLGAVSSVAGAPVRTQTCQTGNSLQEFNYDSTSPHDPTPAYVSTLDLPRIAQWLRTILTHTATPGTLSKFE